MRGVPIHRDIARANRARLKAWRAKKRLNPPTEEPKEPQEKPVGLIRSRKDGMWYVRVLEENGREHRVPTGTADHAAALRAVDESGVQKLAVLARAKVLTANVAQLLIAGHNKTAAEIVDQWQADLKMDYSPSVANGYPANARKMLRRYDCMNKSLNHITRQQLYDYVNDPELKEGGRIGRLAAIKMLYRYAAGYGHIIGNIADTVTVNTRLLTVEQREVEQPIPFTEEEYRRIVSHPKVPQFWRWAVSLGYWLGLRWSDVASLEVASLTRESFVVYPDKTGRKLELPISDPLIGSGELLKVFAEIREHVNLNSTYCFPAMVENENHDRLFKRDALDHAGIRGKSFHGLRHAFKVRLMAAGKTIEEVRDLMGHRSTATTEGYGRVTA